MDPLDFDKVPKLNQKTNRQILLICAGIVWILETVYDLISAQVCPPKKKKSAVGVTKKKKEGTEDKKSDEKTEKKEREKIDWIFIRMLSKFGKSYQ